VTFAVAKYGPRRQVVKERNLFFAWPALLSLLPGAPVLVLSRCPLGVASSFIRGDLFRRWAYRSRYRQMVAMTRTGTDQMRHLAAPNSVLPVLTEWASPASRYRGLAAAM
jgi:hypothetical protein